MDTSKHTGRLGISITYCTKCHFLPRAGWVAQELLHTFEDYVSGVTLIPGGGGQFDVHYGDELLFSNKVEGRFPETRELREMLAARIDDAPRSRHARTDAGTEAPEAEAVGATASPGSGAE
jgi:selenoprotein W-related protein